MKPQVWFCETCGMIAVKMYRTRAGVWEVSGSIMDQHKDESPNCRQIGRERVLVPENLKEDKVLFRGRA